jgi:hypothetical protein
MQIDSHRAETRISDLAKIASLEAGPVHGPPYGVISDYVHPASKLAILNEGINSRLLNRRECDRQIGGHKHEYHSQAEHRQP